MRITDIVKTKKGRYSIFLDGEYFTAIHLDIYVSSHIKINDEVTEDYMLSLKANSEYLITKDRACKFLSKKMYTKKRLIEKLLEYGEPDICEKTANKMEELGLINDTDYAFRYAKDLYNIKGYQGSRIINDLCRKGIDKELAKEAASQFDDNDETEKIYSIIEKRAKTSLTDAKERNRLTGYLVRRGYTFSDINKSISQYIENEE